MAITDNSNVPWRDWEPIATRSARQTQWRDLEDGTISAEVALEWRRERRLITREVRLPCGRIRLDAKPRLQP